MRQQQPETSRYVLILGAMLLVASLIGYRLGSSSSSEAESESISKQSTGASEVLSAEQSTALQKRGWHLGPRLDRPNSALPAFVSHITPKDLPDYQAMPYVGGQPAYEGEPVTAYVKVPSTGQKLALTPNQNGEYPKVVTQMNEAVEVRLAFSRSEPGDPIAISSQDGGRLHLGTMAGMLTLDENRQLPFGFIVSSNPGIHRLSFTTPGGEVKTLQFWAGPEHVLNQRLAAELAKSAQ